MFFFNFGCLNRLGHIFLSLIIMLRHCFCFLWAFFFVLLSILFNLHSSILFGSVTTGSFVAPSILFCCCRKSEYFWMNNKRNQSGETDRERERDAWSFTDRYLVVVDHHSEMTMLCIGRSSAFTFLHSAVKICIFGLFFYDQIDFYVSAEKARNNFSILWMW